MFNGTKRNIFCATLGALACLAGVQQSARADVITTLVSDNAGTGATCGVGNFCYIYDVKLTDSEVIASADTFSGGEFGTLYDVSATAVTVSAVTSTLAADFTFTSALTNTAAYQTAPNDSATLYNVRYRFTAANTTLTGPQDLGQFMITSAAAPGTTIGSYDGQAKHSPGGSEDGNVGSVIVPGLIPSSTPEPTTMLLFGSGLLGLGLLRKRARD